MRRNLVLVTLFALLLALPVAHAQDDLIHTVQPGDNLFRIAQRYGVTVADITAANAITNAWVIYAGQELIIPTAEPEAAPTAVLEPTAPALEPTVMAETEPSPEPTTTETATEAENEPTETEEAVYHVVGYGQSLGSIARQYGVSLEALARANDIANPDLIYAGQALLISGVPAETNDSPRGFEAGSTNSVTHIMQPGETLVSIGIVYNVSWLRIAQANNIFEADAILPGEALIIPGGDVLPGAEHSFITPDAAPAARIGAGREIIVDLSDSRVYAYEDGRLVRNVLVSTGLPATPTVQGGFTVQRKYVSQTMSGPGYYLPEVPYVMYFYAGYALHGTYWHNNWGQPMSHGCVNLPTPEAEWFYTFTDIGTPVYVQA